MWVDGSPQQSLPLTDRTIHYGDGLFETIAVVAGQAQLLGPHLHRLERGCQQLAIPFLEWSQLQDELLSRSQLLVDGVLKVIISRGSGGRGYLAPHPSYPRRIVISSPYPPYPQDRLREGACLCLCQTRLACNPRLAGIKHLNRLEQVLARSEWTDAAIHEGVMLNLDGDVVEGTMSNLFWVRDGVLYTPKLDRCGVDGVMRSQVIDIAQQQGIEIVLCRSSLDACLQAQELFITNSLLGIWPVHRLSSSNYATGPYTQQLYQLLQQRLSGL